MTQDKVTSLTVDVLDHVEVRHGEDRDRLETGAIVAVVGDVGELLALALREQAAVHLRPKASIAFSHICSSYVSKNVIITLPLMVSGCMKAQLPLRNGGRSSGCRIPRAAQ